jgi:DNA-binding MarR family transcriptional regulator
MVEESEVLKKLIVEEKEVTKEMEKMVEEAAKFFRIEKPSGRIIFQNFGALTDQQRVAIVLLGKYFANRLGLVENPILSISEISKEIGRPMTALSRPLKDLITKGFVEKLPGRKYRIAYHRIKEIFEEVLASKSKK